MPGWIFKETDSQKWIEGRFWNHGGKQLAVVAVETKKVDWAAYIGTDAPDSTTELETLKHVAIYGCKLTEAEARFFFPDMPDIKLPYRG